MNTRSIVEPHHDSDLLSVDNFFFAVQSLITSCMMKLEVATFPYVNIFFPLPNTNTKQKEWKTLEVFNHELSRV